eukprot:653095-Prymnesium_polylepis.2
MPSRHHARIPSGTDRAILCRTILPTCALTCGPAGWTCSSFAARLAAIRLLCRGGMRHLR